MTPIDPSAPLPLPPHTPVLIDSAKDLIRNLLQKNPASRPTARVSLSVLIYQL